jgi:phosphoglycolate phosphatase
VPRTLLLDLDGTLIDTVPDLSAALNRLMARQGLPPFSREETAAMVGDGVAPLVRRAFAARDRVAKDADIAWFVSDYGANAAVESRPYPDVPETLQSLHAAGWHLALCTNKLEVAARTLLVAFGLDALFAAVGGGDSFPVRKPDPRHMLATLGAANGAPEQAVAVGDHANDLLAAAGAGIPCIFAAWGYGAAATAHGAAAVACNFAEVPALAVSLLRAV